MKKANLILILLCFAISPAFSQFNTTLGGIAVDADQGIPVVRSASAGLGNYPVPTGPTTILQTRRDFSQTNVDYNISQIETGTYGLFGGADKWLALGIGNPGAGAGVPQPYGLCISFEKDFAFYNLLQEGPRKNLLATFSRGLEDDFPNFFIVRNLRDLSGTDQIDLITADPQGATGINKAPQSSLWVDSKLTRGFYEDPTFGLLPIQKSIAIIGNQRLENFGNPSLPDEVTTASAIGNQANTSLASTGVAVEGFRAQLPDFETVALAGANPEGVATNLQVVNNPFGPTNPTIDVVGPPFNEYAELTWQDLNINNFLSDDCNTLPYATAETFDKFFISFRNNQSAFPFGTGNKLPVMTFQGNGRVGIGTTQPTSGDPSCLGKAVLLDVNGSIMSGGALVTSDRRFKKDIEPITNGLELVRKIQGRTYTFNHEAFPNRNFSKGNQFGFIAQELAEVVPEVTLLNSDGYYAVDYTMLIPVLTEAIKEQDETMLAQQETIARLEAELQDIRNQVMGLRSADAAAPTKGYSLMQNSPNPFSNATQISYQLPDGTMGASINVYDLNGRLLQSYPLTEARGQVDIKGNDLAAGIYIYDLLVGGRQIDVKRMVLNRLD